MHTTHSTTTAERINALIAAADAERWLEWHGPAAERARHQAEADRHLDQLRRLSVAWADEVRDE